MSDTQTLTGPSDTDDFVDDNASTDPDLSHEPSGTDGDGEPNVLETPQQLAVKAKSKNAERALARRAAEKTLQLVDASPAELELAASLLGTKDTVADVAVAALFTPKSALAVVDDLEAIQSEPDPMKAALTAMSFDKDGKRLKRLWDLLVDLGVVSGRPEASEGKLALAIVAALPNVTSKIKATLDKAVELASKK